MRILNYVPCKTKSSRIPGKNLKYYGGKRLIDYTLKFAQKTGNPTLISTDEPSLFDTFDVKYKHLRSNCLASPKLSNLDVMKEIFLSEEYEGFDYICFLQPTHPLRTLKHYLHCCSLINADLRGEIVASSFHDKVEIHGSSRNTNEVEGSIYLLPRCEIPNISSLKYKFWHVPIDNCITVNIDEVEDEVIFERLLLGANLADKGFII